MKKYVFKRYELKYKLTPEQYETIIQEIKKNLCIDSYGETTIQSLYYDTYTNRLIRNSIERPDYKEKIRVRSYGLASPDKKVFLELKKKYNKIVFKRRIEIEEKNVDSFIKNGKESPNQIEKEIIYFCKYYENLIPSMLLIYDRSAYIDQKSDLRITFDKNIRYRKTDLSLCSSLEGEKLLLNGEIIMEVKTSMGYPRWLIEIFNKNKIYKGRFSKYGTAYQLEYKKNVAEKEENYV